MPKGNKTTSNQSSIEPQAISLENARSVKESANERHQRIYQVIRERISLLHYPPHTVIGEIELADEFDVSRTPIRRVLQRLQHEGLVDIRSGVGTVVTDIDIKTMKEVYDLRMYLTELISELSPRMISNEHISKLEALLSRTKLMYDVPDSQAYGRLCNELHEVLISLVGSTPLREITDNLYYRSARIWITFLPNLVWSDVIHDQEMETAEIIAAMKRNDIRGVVQVRRYYLHTLLTRISDYLRGVGHAPVSPMKPIAISSSD